MNISESIISMKAGDYVKRAGWNGKHLGYQKPDENSKMSLPYIYMRTVQGDLVPWIASQTDILAEDYSLIN